MSDTATEFEALRTVSEYLGADHRRLDGILVEVRRDLAKASFDEAAQRFAEFKGGLERHIVAEEDVLFPAFEEATGMRAGPTMVMRAEHEQIRGSMRTAAAALEGRDEAQAADILERLEQLLGDHNLKEEHVLYPMTDRAKGESERAKLVQSMQLVMGR